MAKRIIHQLVDDLDGVELEAEDGETVLFSLDGIGYEIDLSTTNAAALRDALAPYAQAGRRVGASTAGSAARRSRGPAAKSETAAIRAWAAANGHTVSDRGRIPVPVVAAYHAAH